MPTPEEHGRDLPGGTPAAATNTAAVATDAPRVPLRLILLIAAIVAAALTLYSVSRFFLPQNRTEVAIVTIVVIFAALLWLILTIILRPASFEQKKDFIDLYAKILGGATLIVSLYFSWYGIKSTQATAAANLAIADQTLRNARENQISEQYLKNNEKLRDEKLGVRIGAIYAFERLASNIAEEYLESEKPEQKERLRENYLRIIGLLTSYVQENAPWKEPPADAPPVKAQIEPPKDIQIIMNVLGKRRLTYLNGEGGVESRLDLHQTDLRGLTLVDQENLNGVSFREANLEKARLRGIRMKNAILRGAILREANLVNADLEGTDFADADLDCADLSGATGLTAAQIQVAANWETAILPSYLKIETQPCKK